MIDAVVDRIRVWHILLGGLCLRLLFASALGFGVDEAYAVTVARPLSLSYFDHAPLHFWMAACMTWVSGSTAPLVVRLPFLLAFTGTTWAIARITRDWFGESAARVAALMLSASGVLGMTSATWVLPDGPLLWWSSCALLLLAPVLTEPSPRPDRWWRWLLGGAALGLAVLSKYHGALFVAAIGFTVLFDRALRVQLREPWPWLGFMASLSGLVPVLAWNARHQWASFAFQGGRAHATRWSIAPFLESIGGQLLWLLPWVAIPLLIATWRALPRVQVDRRVRLLVSLMAGPVVLFTAVTLGGARGLPHWQAPGWLFGFPLLGAWSASLWRAGGTWTRRWLIGAPSATVALVLLVAAHAQWRVLDPLLTPRARATDPTRDAVSWRLALTSPEKHRTRSDTALVEETPVLLVRSWIQGGQLGVAAGAAPRPIVCLCADPHHFAYRVDPPVPWTRALLVERVQDWRPDWQPADVALSGDSLRIVWRDSVRVDPAVLLARYDVTRRVTRAARVTVAW